MTSHDPLGITPDAHPTHRRKAEGNIEAPNHTDPLKIVHDARSRKFQGDHIHVKQTESKLTRKRIPLHVKRS